ncbi:Cytochrome oxidase biogenesis protein Cox11-CtaG, copper delivery to Cox1 [Vibrio casei]|uniref:Cytochrome c oxidase assembly protein CtaG n=1 Tax=Vibrio casei TaxID=673372 RepID=A0A368LJF9_9VIBR|nr:cytochrome c oxidase assembly protein [Vibrio casei]SJN25197.1 Cytochrome oxidase biogenesis protein Cox11-CtaG, copper delivery to Cox1 [Vibrio casei]HBV76828.1 cytochrome c oxidase assembly protein [Vibrio sp.]
MNKPDPNKKLDANQQMASSVNQSANNKKLIGYLLFGVVGMFAFGFALVPLYDIMCEQLGINGKTNTVAASSQGIQVDESRLVRVQFMAQVSPNMPWTFEPVEAQMDVHPGQVIRTSYRAVNKGDMAMIGQAVPSIAPGIAATHFNKIECFCFNHQPLEARTEAELPVIFYVDNDLPTSVNRLTLSYTLFDITASAAPKKGDIEGVDRTENTSDTTNKQNTSNTTMSRGASMSFAQVAGSSQKISNDLNASKDSSRERQDEQNQ